jgi:hypothetical protein
VLKLHILQTVFLFLYYEKGRIRKKGLFFLEKFGVELGLFLGCFASKKPSLRLAPKVDARSLPVAR